ncbi:MAG: SLC13 family permease [Nitrospinota bacterium]|nr:SLC13 family permease [Nitrospinota bacterium]
MEPVALTPQIITVIIVIAVAIFLFVTELVRVDVVAIIIMVMLPILGLVGPKEAFAGLSSNAVVSIIAVIILGAGLDKTGIMNKVAAPIVRFAGDSYPRVVLGISGAVGIISSFMQNIGAAALFLPATMRVSRHMNIPLSRLLMPMGYCAILGGTVTLVGSSPLILLNDLLPPGTEHFGLFSVTPIGLMLLASGLAYFIFLGKHILPEQKGAKGEPKSGALRILKEYSATQKIMELAVPQDFAESGKTLEDLALRKAFLVTVIGRARKEGTEKVISPLRTHRVLAGDVLAVIGEEENIKKMATHFGFHIHPEKEIFREDMAVENAGLLEAVVAPDSPLTGSTLRKEGFQQKFQIMPVALYREGMVFVAGIGDIPLKQGDTLLLHGVWESFSRMRTSPDLLFAGPAGFELFRKDKAAAALFAFGLTIAMVIGMDVFDLKLTLSNCLMTGALAMILLRVLSVDEAYKSVDWRTVFLLGGLIPLGVATERSGAAAYIAQHTLSLIGTVSPVTLMVVIAILSTAFTLVISNVGATVLLVPLAWNMAQGAGADPRMAALVVGLVASNSFILPTHQVNALLMGPGGYRTVDYIRAGGGMTVIFILVTVLGVWLFYGI